MFTQELKNKASIDTKIVIHGEIKEYRLLKVLKEEIQKQISVNKIYSGIVRSSVSN